MGIGEAFINVLLSTQRIIHSPMYYDKTMDRLIPNPNLGQPWKLWRWHIGNIFICSVWLFSIAHLAILFIRSHNGAEGLKQGVKEEVLVYVFAIAITTQAIATWETMTRDPIMFSQLEGQILKACGVGYRGWTTAYLEHDIPEIASYSLSVGFFIFPFLATSLPIARDYDPINQMFLTFIPFHVDPQIRLGLVVLAYLLSCTFGAISCLNLILLTASHDYSSTRLSRKNLEISTSFLRPYPSILGLNENDKSQITPVELRNLRRVFRSGREAYHQLKIITTSVNGNRGRYIPTMVGVGVYICIFSNYGVIQFHNRLPEVMILGMASISFFCSVNMVAMIFYGSYPKTLSERFVRLWRRLDLGRRERMQMAALPQVFMEIGQYFSVKTSTALDVMDTVLQGTISLLMY